MCGASFAICLKGSKRNDFLTYWPLYFISVNGR